MATLRSNLSNGAERLGHLHSTWLAVLLTLFPLVVVAEATRAYDGQPLVPIVVLSAVVAAVLVRVRPAAHEQLRWFGAATLATFVGLGWAALFVTGQWLTAWATVPEAMLLYMLSGALAYDLVYRGGIAWLGRHLGRR